MNKFNLEQRRKELGFTLEQIGKFVGVSKSTVQKWESGFINNMKRDKIALLAKILRVSPLYIIGIDASEENLAFCNPIVQKIPVLNCISAKLPLYTDEQIIDYTYTEYNDGAEYFALKVKGDSMSASRINDGDTIIVRKQETVENGEIAVVRVNREDVIIRRFSKDRNIVQLIPQSFNPDHHIQLYDLKNTNVAIIGKVVECKIEF